MANLDRYRQLLQNEHIRRTLNTIRHAEGTSGEAGYRTMFGGGTFDTSGGWRHPDRVIRSGGYASAAAGAYQFMPDTWAEWSKKTGVSDFSPQSQDLVALNLIEGKRGVNLDEIAKGGLTKEHIHKLAPEWASLPTASGKSYYGQPVKSLDELNKVYGGEIGSGSSGGGSGTVAATPGAAGGGEAYSSTPPVMPSPMQMPDPVSVPDIQMPQPVALPKSLLGDLVADGGSVLGGDSGRPSTFRSGQRSAGGKSFFQRMSRLMAIIGGGPG